MCEFNLITNLQNLKTKTSHRIIDPSKCASSAQQMQGQPIASSAAVLEPRCGQLEQFDIALQMDFHFFA
jgi:hypothetical protein